MRGGERGAKKEIDGNLAEQNKKWVESKEKMRVDREEETRGRETEEDKRMRKGEKGERKRGGCK